MRPLITLLTDFGTADGTVAEIKATLYSAIDDVTIVDVTHDLPPGETELARLALARYWRRFPQGTVHLVVVASGNREESAVAVGCEGRFLIGYDNGVLSPALLSADARVRMLPLPADAAIPVIARDVLAPAAAALSRGAAVESLGPPHEAPVIRRTPLPVRVSDGVIAGEVIAIDRTGSAITNLLAPRGGVVEVAGRSVPVLHVARDGDPGDVFARVGANGLLEIVQNGGSAGQALGLVRGAPVILRSAPPVA